MRHTQFFFWVGSHIGNASWNIQHILWLISSFKQRDVGEILVDFQGRWTSIYYFLDSQIFDEVLDIFPRLSYRLTFIMLNMEMVDNLEFWVDNFWIPRPKTRVPLPGFTQPNFGGDKIKGHKRKVDTNRLASETRQIWKDLLLLDSSNVHPQYEKKKIKERRQISTVNDDRYSLNTDNLGWN